MVGGSVRPGTYPESICSTHHRVVEGSKGEEDIKGEEGPIGREQRIVGGFPSRVRCAVTDGLCTHLTSPFSPAFSSYTPLHSYLDEIDRITATRYFPTDGMSLEDFFEITHLADLMLTRSVLDCCVLFRRCVEGATSYYGGHGTRFQTE